MALTTTTLTSAIGLNDTSMAVTSATGFAAGSIVLIDSEFLQVAKGYPGTGLVIPIIRGQQGTATAAHPSGANVTVGVGADFAAGAPGATSPYPLARPRQQVSYSASGNIALPTPGTDLTAIINGTSTLAMVVPAPTKDMDGTQITVVGNGKSASSVQFTGGAGAGGSAYDVFTFQTGAQLAISAVACNGAWVLSAPVITGTTTALGAGVA